MVDVTEHVKTRPQGCAAAVLWDSPCSQTAKPVKVSKFVKVFEISVREAYKPALSVSGAWLLLTERSVHAEEARST